MSLIIWGTTCLAKLEDFILLFLHKSLSMRSLNVHGWFLDDGHASEGMLGAGLHGLLKAQRLGRGLYSRRFC